MNWKSGLFRVWLVASACWVVLVAWVAYVDVVAPSLQAHRCQKLVDACVAARKAHPELGNLFGCFDTRPTSHPFDDLIRRYAVPGVQPPSCEISDDFTFESGALGRKIAWHVAFAITPPLGAMVLWWIGIWIAAGFRRTTG